ncbi:MAG: flavin reductase family protein [Planctomycetaceae bacterium]
MTTKPAADSVEPWPRQQAHEAAMIEAAGQIWRRIDRELWVVTARHDGVSGGLLATTVGSVSIIPTEPRLVVTLAKTHHTTGLAIESGAFAVHLLRADQGALAEWFGLSSGRDGNKFTGLKSQPGITGSPILLDAPAAMECRIESRTDIGDRWLLVGRVLEARNSGESFPPLTLHQWLPQLSEETRNALKAQLITDAKSDAAALTQWRAEQ